MTSVYIVYSVDSVYSAYNADYVYSVYSVDSVYSVYNVYYTVYTMYTVYIAESYYHNIVMTWNKIQPLCTLRTPFDLVFNDIFNHGYHPIQPSHKYMFYKYAHNSGPKGSPDMILIAFHLKFRA